MVCFLKKVELMITGTIHILTLPKYNMITHGKKCFIYKGTKLWNSISNGIKTIENISKFKTLLKKWNWNKYPCRFINKVN